MRAVCTGLGAVCPLRLVARGGETRGQLLQLGVGAFNCLSFPLGMVLQRRGCLDLVCDVDDDAE